jgi:hypothetical protein
MASEKQTMVFEVEVKDPSRASVASPIKARLEQQAQSPRKFSPKLMEEKNKAAEQRRAKRLEVQKQKAAQDGQHVKEILLQVKSSPRKPATQENTQNN